MPKLKTKQKELKTENIQIRVTVKQKNAIKRKAKMYGTDMTTWILHAGVNYIPSEDELDRE